MPRYHEFWIEPFNRIGETIRPTIDQQNIQCRNFWQGVFPTFGDAFNGGNFKFDAFRRAVPSFSSGFLLLPF